MYCLLAAKTLYLCGFFASSYITIRTKQGRNLLHEDYVLVVVISFPVRRRLRISGRMCYEYTTAPYYSNRDASRYNNREG